MEFKRHIRAMSCALVMSIACVDVSANVALAPVSAPVPALTLPSITVKLDQPSSSYSAYILPAVGAGCIILIGRHLWTRRKVNRIDKQVDHIDRSVQNVHQDVVEVKKKLDKVSNKQNVTNHRLYRLGRQAEAIIKAQGEHAAKLLVLQAMASGLQESTDNGFTNLGDEVSVLRGTLYEQLQLINDKQDETLRIARAFGSGNSKANERMLIDQTSSSTQSFFATSQLRMFPSQSSSLLMLGNKNLNGPFNALASRFALQAKRGSLEHANSNATSGK